MTDLDHILDQLQREVDGDPWHGPSLAQILEGITADQAARRAVPNAHTIWELVLHMTGWKREVARRLRGHPAGEPETGDWPAPGDQAEARWNAAKAGLVEAQRDLISAIRAVPLAGLHTPVKDPRNPPLETGMTVYQTIYGIIQHDVYHAGQIALLKKALL